MDESPSNNTLAPLPVVKPKRAPNGQGYVALRPDGLWTGQITIGKDKQGKRVRKVVYARSEDEVRRRLERIRQIYFVPLSGIAKNSVARFLAQWLEDKRATLARSTAEGYLDSIKRVAAKIGDLPLDVLGPRHLHDMHQALAADGCSRSMIHRDHRMLSSALSDATALELTQRNVAKLIRPPSYRRPEARFWTVEQARTFLGTVKVRWLYVLCTLALTTGMRIGELLGLQWCFVDLEQGVVGVRWQVDEQRNSYKGLKLPKTHSGIRQIKLFESTRLLLVEWHRETAEYSTRFVFTSSRDTDRPMLRASVHHAFRKALIGTPVPYIRFHEQRHTLGALAVAAGVHERALQRIMGHASPATTREIYEHASRDVQGEAIAAMELLFGPAIRVEPSIKPIS